MKKNNDINNKLIFQIANHLLLNASYIPNLGLIHGRMGIVLFFYHLARYSKNNIYEEFANELIDSICRKISMDTPLNFENGLCGIAWGFEYLLQNGFIEGNSDEILAEIDNEIMKLDLSEVIDLSFKTGLGGLYFYILYRLRNESLKVRDGLLSENYLSFFTPIKNNIILPNQHNIFKEILNTYPESKSMKEWNLGLENGCAGIGLNLLI